MALSYDFDIGGGAIAEPRAMFRDQATVDALQGADPAVQAFFTDSGFALKTYNSGAPPGRYPARDEEARTYVIERLSENLSLHDLNGAHWGGFDFRAFMTSLSEVEPVDDELLAPTGPRRIDEDLLAARLASRQKKGKRRMAFGGLLLGFILLLYVAAQSLPG